MAVQVGEWSPVAVGDGDALALDGRRVAVASPARLEVVDGPAAVAAVDAPWPAPGVPRFHADRVLWGPGVLDLGTGRYRPVAAAAPASWPGGGERPSVYAWSEDGSRLVAAFDTRTVLLSADGEQLRAVPTSTGLAPAAAFVGRDHVVVDLVPFGLDLMPVVALSADLAERHLVAVALNQAMVSVDLGTGAVVDQWPGDWSSVAVSPDGRYAAALASSGAITIAELVDGRIVPRTDVAPPVISGPPRAIAFDGSAVGVCGGGMVAVAQLGAR